MVDVLGFQANYTGPYLSDGKFQSSVEFGETLPITQWDAFSRLHDSAFAHWDDYGHRTAANSIYNQWMKENPTVSKNLAGWLVLYGNQIGGSFKNLGPNLGSMIVGGVKNGYNLADYMLNEDKYKKDVLNYFKTDPKLGDSRYDPSVWNGHPVPLDKVDPFDVGGVKKMGNGSSNENNHGSVYRPNEPRNPNAKYEGGFINGPMVHDSSLGWRRERSNTGRIIYNPYIKRHKKKSMKKIYVSN